MERLLETRQARPGWLGRLVYWVAGKKLGHVPETLKVINRNTALLVGVSAFETAIERSTAVPSRLKHLAQLRVAVRIGCPF